MSIHRGRRPGTWRVCVWTSAGQREWIVEGTKAEARRFHDRKRVELSDPSPAAKRAVPTFRDFSTNDYEPHAKATLGGNTWKRARRYIVMLLTEHFAETRLDRLEPVQVERYSQKRLARGIEPSTVNNELAVLGTMLRWARDVMHLRVVPLTIKKLRVDKKKRVKVWSSDEVRRLYAGIRATHPDLLPMVEFMFNTGCRKGEAVAARWDWVDARARLLRIPVTEEWRPKDREAREVPIDGLMPMLSALPRESPVLFPNAYGRPYRAFPDSRFRECVAAAKLEGSPHRTRHTYASHFLQACPDLGLLAAVLGHSHTQVTEIYAHLLPGHLDRARGAVSLSPSTLAKNLAKKRRPASFPSSA